MWEGDRPPTDKEGLARFRSLYDAFIDNDDGEDPSPAIQGYVTALLQRWPDITEPNGEASPWVDGPLVDNASGPFIYFAMSWSQAEEASSFAARLAHEHGLVCFDPQTEIFRTS